MDQAFLEKLGIDQQAREAILQAHTDALQQVRFESILHRTICQAGGRNVKAVTAMLDMDALQKAQDPQDAAQAAVEQLKKENAWLFAAPAAPYAPGTGANQRFTTAEPQSLADALKQMFGRR